MKKIIGLLAMVLLGFKLAFSQTIPLGNPTLPGIVKTTENVKTYVFEIKLEGSVTADQARILDANMISKQGILSSTTSLPTNVCRVEVLKSVKESYLRDVVSYSGLSVSKAFTE